MVKTKAAEGTMLETAWEIRWVPDSGGVAQLGEHLPCKQGVRGSTPLISMDLFRRSNDFLFLENRITNLILKIFSATVSVKGN